VRHFRARSAAGFGSISRRERYQADVFFADLTGTRRQGRRRRQAPAAETYAEQRPLSLGPLTEREWEMVISMLTRGDADVGRPLTGKAGENALLVAARIFCDRNALSLEGGDPLMCIVSDATLADARVRSLVPHVTARGPIINWTRVKRDARVLQVMRLLVRTHGYPANAAAGLAGNFIDESNMLPQRVQGSADETPMRAQNLAGGVTDFTAADVMNRNAATRTGPLLEGVGLAQWTLTARRRGLFAHTFRGLRLGARVLFDLDAQVDYAATELRMTSFAPLQRVLTNAAVTVDSASDAVALQYENPRSVAPAPIATLPATHPLRVQVLQQRRASSRRALEIFNAAENPAS